MELGQHAQLADLKPKFKGLLTNLLAEAFYEEEYCEEEIPEFNEEIVEHKNTSIKQIRNYIKSFT